MNLRFLLPLLAIILMFAQKPSTAFAQNGECRRADCGQRIGAGVDNEPTEVFKQYEQDLTRYLRAKAAWEKSWEDMNARIRNAKRVVERGGKKGLDYIDNAMKGFEPSIKSTRPTTWPSGSGVITVVGDDGRPLRTVVGCIVPYVFQKTCYCEASEREGTGDCKLWWGKGTSAEECMMKEAKCLKEKCYSHCEKP